jgi:hypothetical protein
MEEFDIFHRQLGIRVGCHTGGYGKLLQIECPHTDSHSLTSALRNVFHFSFKREAGHA